MGKMQDFYVYVYLDPRKPGPFMYLDIMFDYEPFYVGKGRNWRFRYHLLNVKRGNFSNLPNNQKIKEILESGNEPIILKFKENLEESQAFQLEEDLISKIGRRDLLTGPLKNLSNGGEGNANRKFSEEHRKNLSVSRKGKITENMITHLKKLHCSLKGNKHTLGFKFSESQIQKLIQSHYKPIVQLDLDGNPLKEFSSIKQAKEVTGINMTKVLSGKAKTAGGSKWKYKI